MNEVIQWSIVGVLVAVSVGFLVKRLVPSRKNKGCAGACDSCPFSKGFAEQCKERH